MSFTKPLLAAAAAVMITLPAFAGSEIEIIDPYARAAGPAAKAGGSFMVIKNTGDSDDRLISASTDAAKRVELHTHIKDGDVMRMVEVEEGFEVPAGGMVELKRGGYHVMMMGLTGPLVQGESITVTLSFEHAGDMDVIIPIDNERMDAMHGGHGN